MIISLKNIFEALKEANAEEYKGCGQEGYDFLYTYSNDYDKNNYLNETNFIYGWFKNSEIMMSVFITDALNISYMRSQLFIGYGKDFFTGKGKYKTKLEENIIGKSCPDSVLTDLSNAIKKTLSEHCAYFFYARVLTEKNKKSPNKLVLNNPKITDIEKNRKIHLSEFENNQISFEQKLINNISSKIDWQNVNRLFGSHLKDILDDKNIKSSIKLGVITILSLVPSDKTYHAFTKGAYREIVKDFIDRIPAVHTLNRDDVWAAGKLWYEESRESESRFSEFDPIVNLFPLVDLSKMVPKDDPSEKKRDNKLLSVIRDTPGHLFLVGEGGIGKTSVLYNIMKAAYSENSNNSKEIPLYIELSKAISKKDFDKEDQWSNYIINSIKRQLQKLPNIDTVPNEEIEKILKKYNSDEPEFVLLLDGLNEISLKSLYGSTVYLMVVNEIKCILKDWKNVRVILTSRSKAKDIFEDNITILELSGIDDEYIYEYLEKTVSQSKIDFVKNNQTLLETLRVPLFLTIFAEIENVDELLSRGEILDAFFTQTKEKLYTEQSNFLRIQREHLSLQANTAITLAMASFIYDFVIPEIAWEMVQKNSFQISETNIEAIIQKVLDGDGGKSPYCWAHGDDCFSEEYKGLFNESPSDVKQRFIDCFGEKKAPTIIRRFIIQQRAILVYDSKNNYEFKHQHFRDYFAALYHIKRLKLAIYVNEDPEINDYHLAREYLSEWRKPLPSQVLIFIGEILGEVHNIPQYIKDENRWLFEPNNDYIKRGLDIYRITNKSEKAIPEDRYAVWNLFQILKLVRKDLSGEDFSNLDLSICHANGFRLGNNTYSANFDGSILTDAFFAPSGHTSPITDACFSPDSRCILSIDQDSTVKIWNAITCEVICTLPSFGEKIVSYCFHPTKKLFLLVNTTGIFRTYNFDEYSVTINHMHNSRVSINNAQYINNGKCIFASSNDDAFVVFDSETFEDITDTYGDVFKEKLSHAIFSPKGNYILTIPIENNNTSTIKIWSAKNNHKFLYSIQRPLGIKSVQFSPDEKKIIECYGWRLDKKTLIIDAKSTELVASLNNCDCVQYSPLSGDYILTSSSYGEHIVYETEHYNKVVHAQKFSFAHFSPDGNYIITAHNDFSKRSCDVIIRDTTTLAEVPGGVLKGYTERLNAAIFTPDSNHIISVSADGTTKAWTICQPLKEISEGAFHEYTNNLRLIQYSTKGNCIVTVSNEGIIKVWDANTNEEIKSIKEDIYCSSAQLNPDGTRILITDKSSLFSEVLNAEPGKPAFEYEYESDSSLGPLWGSKDSNKTISAEYSHDGRHIVTASFIGTVTIWDTSVLSNYQEFIGDHWDSFEYPLARVRKARTTPSVSFVPNDEKIVLIHEESNTWYLEIHEKEKFALVSWQCLEFANVNSVLTISPKSDYIATSHWDDNRNTGIVKLWTLDLVEVLGGTIEFSNQHIKSVQFSPNGEYLLVVTSQNDKESASVWSIKAEQSERVSVSKIQTIPNYPGLEVWNVDLQKINKHSDISNEMRKHLIEYGALINEEEAQHERTINDSEKTTHRLR